MTPKYILAAALAGTFLLSQPVSAQESAPRVAPSVAPVDPAEVAAMRSLLEASYKADEPGVAVIVMRGDTLVYTDGIGVADAESGAPIGADTVFRYASITKQFAAATLLQMVDEGLLSLDDPLSKFLPDYPGDGAAVTVRQLLNHTSGIKSYTGIPGWMVAANTARASTGEEMVAVFADQPLDFTPGTAYAYNNSGYYLVGMVIEAVSGRPWYEELDRRIAQPLALSTLAYRTDEAAQAGFATGYTLAGDGPFGASQPVHPSVPGAAGALSGTVGDMARWSRALHGGEVLEAQTYAAMIAPTVLANGEEVNYGFGLGLDDVRGRPTIGHSGGIFGFTTDSIYLPDKDLFIAVFANSDSPAIRPGTTMRRLAAIAIGDPYVQLAEAAPDMAAIAPWLGVYDMGDGETRTFFERDGKLYTLRSGRREMEVFFAGEDRFFYGPDSLTWFSMVRNGEGTPVMEMHQFGANDADLSTRIGDVPQMASFDVPHEVLQSYVGSYDSAIGTLVVAMAEDGRLTGKLGLQPAFPLVPESATRFAVEGVDATIAFTVTDGAVAGLTIAQGGQELPFARQPGD